MKPRSKTESYWRTAGRECRKYWQQGPGAAKTARQFTQLEAHRAMRAQDKADVHEGMDELLTPPDPDAGHV